MSTINSHNLDSLTGITTILGTGSVTPTSGGGRNFLRIVGQGVWDTNGFSVDTPTTGARKQVFYFSAQSTAVNALFGFATSQTLSQTAMIGFGFTSASVRAWSGVGFVGASLSFTASTWYDFMTIIGENGDIQLYARVNDGSEFEDAENWTYFANVTQATTFDPLGSSLYFVAQAQHTGNTDIDNFVATDNGYSGPGLNDEIIDYSELDDYVGWTEIATGSGTNTTTTEGGRTFSRAIGENLWGTTGIYRTTPIVGAMGHVIYIDFRGGTTNPDSMILIRDSVGIGHTPATVGGFYCDGIARATYWHGLLTNTTVYTNNAWINERFVLEASGRFNLYIHEDDGSDPWSLDESDWTWIGLGSPQVYRGGNVYIAHNHFTAGATESGDIDRYYYTANGAIPTEDTGIGTPIPVRWKRMGRNGLYFPRRGF